MMSVLRLLKLRDSLNYLAKEEVSWQRAFSKYVIVRERFSPRLPSSGL